MRRNQNPFATQRIEPAMGMFFKVEIHKLYHFALTSGRMGQVVAFAWVWSLWCMRAKARAGVSQNGRNAAVKVTASLTRLA